MASTKRKNHFSVWYNYNSQAVIDRKYIHNKGQNNIPLFSVASAWQPNDEKANILYVNASPFWNAIPDVPNPQAQYTGPDMISLYAQWTGINAAIMRYIINKLGFHHTVHKHYIGIKGH